VANQESSNRRSSALKSEVLSLKPSSKAGFMWAFVLGMVLMLAVYTLFQWTGKRTRSGTDKEDTSLTHVGGTYASVVLAERGEDAAPAPSAFLGVEIISVSDVGADQLGIPGGNGVLINGVVPLSPAQKAGLARGDVIVALSNSTVKDVDRFREVMAELEPGERVRIVFIRSGKRDLTYAELVEAPAIQRTAETPSSSDAAWGAALAPLTPSLRATLSIPPDIQGVAILSVVPGGAADAAGLMPGDVIRGIDKTPISDMDDFFNAASSDSDDTALLDIYGQGRMRYVPMDSSSIQTSDQTQTQTTLRQRIFSIFTGGSPFSTEDDEDESGPKGGKFAQDGAQLTADTGFARPSVVPGDANTGGPTAGSPGFSRPSTVPGATNTGGGSQNDVVLFIALLLIALVYLAYREFHRPPETCKK